MHTIEFYGGRIWVVFNGNGQKIRLFRFEHERINTALALVNWLNGGSGEAFPQDVSEKEVYANR